jgi:hypothetical protein
MPAETPSTVDSASVRGVPLPGATAASGAASSVEGGARTLHGWAVAHDDSRLFLAGYIGLAVVLSVWISLFWLVAVVAVHFGLELVRQSQRHTGPVRVVLESSWEVKLDVALVLLALVLSLYMHVVLGLVGLQGVARLGSASRVVSRVAGWERTIRGIVLSADDAAQVARAAVMRRGARPVEGGVPAEPAHPLGTWHEPWGAGTWIALALGGVCLLLMAAAPWLTDHTVGSALAQLARELRPLP